MKEEDLKGQCVYCGNHMNDKRWISNHFGGIHYKETVCSCGHNHRIRVNMDTSGHDNWDGKWLGPKEFSELRKKHKEFFRKRNQENLENKVKG
ncbi:MAG: hypothetical protein ACQEP1_02910 [Nanobdellota archaeon]